MCLFGCIYFLSDYAVILVYFMSFRIPSIISIHTQSFRDFCRNETHSDIGTESCYMRKRNENKVGGCRWDDNPAVISGCRRKASVKGPSKREEEKAVIQEVRKEGRR